mgnify:CR=1 FL=1
MGREFAITLDETEVVRRIDYSVTGASLSKGTAFDPVADLETVVESAITKAPESDHLRYSAAQAIQRLKSRADQSTDAWVEELSSSFFTDLEQSSQ